MSSAKVLTVSDVQNILKIGKNQAYDLFHRRDFPTIHIGARLRVTESAFAQWLEAQGGMCVEQ